MNRSSEDQPPGVVVVDVVVVAESGGGRFSEHGRNGLVPDPVHVGRGNRIVQPEFEKLVDGRKIRDGNLRLGSFIAEAGLGVDRGGGVSAVGVAAALEL